MKRQIARNVARNDKKALSQLNRDRNLLVNLARNGITVEDVKKETDRVRKETYERTSTAIMQVVYASLASVLADDYGFTKDQCFDALYAVDRKVATSIDNEELIAEMEEKAGVRFNCFDGVERIEKI